MTKILRIIYKVIYRINILQKNNLHEIVDSGLILIKNLNNYIFIVRR